MWGRSGVTESNMLSHRLYGIYPNLALHLDRAAHPDKLNKRLKLAH